MPTTTVCSSFYKLHSMSAIRSISFWTSTSVKQYTGTLEGCVTTRFHIHVAERGLSSENRHIPGHDQQVNSIHKDKQPATFRELDPL